jgi:predicted small lipoprotein YifL
MVLRRWEKLLGLVLLFFIGLLVAGCGQKGPLYLPREAGMVQKAA